MTPRVIPRSELTPLTDAELAALEDDDRKVECWMLCMTGMSQRKAAEHFGVTPTTIRNWLDAVAKNRRTRAEDIDLEVERLVGQMEAVAARAWKGAEQNSGSSMAGPAYLKMVIEAVQVIARFRGIDGVKKEGSGSKTTTVVVRFGGTAGGGKEQPTHPGAIDVAVQELETA